MTKNMQVLLGVVGSAIVILLIIAGISGSFVSQGPGMGGMMGGYYHGVGTMMGGGMMGGGFIGLLIMLVFWAVLVALLVALFMWFINRNSTTTAKRPE